MHIGILLTGHAPEALRPGLGEYDEMFAQLLSGHGFRFSTYAVVDMIFPSGPEAADGWLITGSKHGAYEDLPFIPPLEALIRAIYAADRPLIGVCFGHQIIAQALGGRVEKFAGGWSIGRTVYTHEGEETHLQAWHQDQVVEPPAEAEVIGFSSFCPFAALQYGDKAWTIQAHPEYDHRFIEGLMETRGPGVVPDALLEAAREEVRDPLNRSRIAADMAAFFKREELT